MSEPAVAPDPNAAASTVVVADPNSSPAASTSVPVDYWGKGWVKEDGSLDNSRLEKLPEELKPLAPELKNFKNMDEFLKSTRELRTMASKKGLVEPLPSNATKEQIEERSALLRKVNGAPDKPDGYGLTKPETVPAEMWDQDFANACAVAAHKYGLPPAALKELAGLQIASVQKDLAARQQSETAWFQKQDQLIRETAQKEGLTFDKAAELAKRAGLRWGVAPDSPLMKNASVFLLLTRLGSLMAEPGLVKGDMADIHMAGSMKPEESAAAAKDIQSNPKNPLYDAYWNRHTKEHHITDEEHKVAVDRQQALSRIGYANRPMRGGR